MQNLDFTFLNSSARRLSRWWLLLGALALALAGLFSLTLIIGRSPGLSKLPFFVNLFHVSIVAHVDLSVLAWFLCIACMVWSLGCKKSPVPMLEESALISMGLGIVLIALAPFTGGEALMSNYIPVIMSPVFFFGLALIGISAALMAVNAVLNSAKNLVLFSSAVIFLISLAAFYASYELMPSVIDGEQYFELLFWGGGHVLQFLHVQILMLVWLFLAASSRPPLEGGQNFLKEIQGGYEKKSSTTPPDFSKEKSALPQGEGGSGGNIISFLFLINLVTALLTPLGYLHDITSSEHHQFFTQTMIIAGGIAPAILALLLLPKIWRARGERKGENRALWSALVVSIFLFLYGGVLGGMIEGQNVVIPAHYHGSIIGITIAFMGFAYALLPAFGYRRVSQWKLAYWQPIIYGAGQFMHVTGLAVSGGYGVLRKTPGGLDALAPSVKIAMGFMGLGGLIAAIGGIMFVVVVFLSVRKKT